MANDFGVEVELTGFETLISKLNVLPGNAKEGALRRIFQYCDKVMMPDSKENYCPFDLGALRDSGTVFRDEDNVYCEYGSPSAPGRGKDATPPSEYAVDQHENLTYDHSPATGHGGGGAKYLELPLIKHTNRIYDAAGQGVNDILEVDTGMGKDIRPISFTVPLFDMTHGTTSAPAPTKTKTLGAPRLVKKAK